MEAIRTEKLTKYYGKNRGIVSLDLTVGEGEFFGFIGPNGAGKSTTIRTLLGLISPTSGSARVLGKDIVKEKEEILRLVGYLPSEVAAYPGMKGKELIRLSAELRKEDCRAEADRLCQLLEFDPSRRVEELSFGNRKKLGIICALQAKPPLLILDEPTGGLDPLMQRAFFKILQERSREGATIFLSSHVLSEVQRYASRAAVIREGSIIACGSVEELAGTSAKRVSVRGSCAAETLPGVRDLTRTEEGVSFLYSGEMSRLIAVLSAGQIEDLTVSEPDLEEIFLHFYEKEGKAE